MKSELEIKRRIDITEFEIENLRNSRNYFNSDLVDIEIHEKLQVLKELKWILEED